MYLAVTHPINHILHGTSRPQPSEVHLPHKYSYVYTPPGYPEHRRFSFLASVLISRATTSDIAPYDGLPPISASPERCRVFRSRVCTNRSSSTSPTVLFPVAPGLPVNPVPARDEATLWGPHLALHPALLPRSSTCSSRVTRHKRCLRERVG